MPSPKVFQVPKRASKSPSTKNNASTAPAKAAHLNGHTTAPHLTLLPLGGVGRIGMNAMLLGYGDDLVLLDCGVMFPESDQMGVDVVLPSLAVLARFKARIRAIVITHGHEDHIGALPHVLKVLQVPVYATRFTCALIQHKLREHDMLDAVDLNLIGPGKRLQVGPFDFSFLRVTHSIPDCVSLAIRTPVGNVLFTGDFKIEEGLRDGIVFDAEGFKAFGDEGVLVMMSDSTNAEVPGWSASESSVAIALEKAMAPCTGRILVSQFASNVYRMHAVIEAARKHGRYTALAGRSLGNYIAAANSGSDMPFDPEDFIDLADIDKYDDDEICIICTGSQGEPRAALARMALGTHPSLSVKPGDTLLMSSRQIPGNERKIHAMLNDFARRGAHIIYQRNNRDIHASGHAYADEQLQLLKWVRPRFFYPVHGEYTFLQRHADIAAEMGVEQTIVAENGQIIVATKDGVTAREFIDVQPWYADGAIVGDAETLEIKSRGQLAWNGVIAVSLYLTRDEGLLTAKAKVRPHGVYQAQGQLTEELEQALDRWGASLDPATPKAALEAQLVQAVRRFCKRFTTRKPVVLPFIHSDAAVAQVADPMAAAQGFANPVLAALADVGQRSRKGQRRAQA